MDERITPTAARVNANLKQSEAAEKLGVGVSRLIRYEKYPDVIPAGILRKMAELYRVSVRLLI